MNTKKILLMIFLILSLSPFIMMIGEDFSDFSSFSDCANSYNGDIRPDRDERRDLQIDSILDRVESEMSSDAVSTEQI